MNENMLVNGLNFLKVNGISEVKALDIVKQAKRDFISLPIEDNIENVFYTYLKLSIDIELHKQTMKQTYRSIETKKQSRSLDYYDNRIKSTVFEYKQ